MKVFLTGATGYIGAVVAEKLQAAGHHIIGLTRTKTKAEALRKWEIEPFLGDLRNPDNLIPAVQQADGIIHTAFTHTHNFYQNLATSIQIERNFIATMRRTLAGSGKPFVATSNTGVLGDTGLIIASESYPTAKRSIISQHFKIERDMRIAAKLDIRTVVLRLPIYIYGRARGTLFTEVQIKAACEMGIAYYIEPGNQLVSASHVDDVAQLYLLALEKAPPGSLFHAATQSGITTKSISEVIADITECEAESICFEEAVFNWGYPLAKFLSINNQTSATKATYQLGWQPQITPTLLSDIKLGSYRTLCCNLSDSTRIDMLRMLYTQKNKQQNTQQIPA